MHATTRTTASRGPADLGVGRLLEADVERAVQDRRPHAPTSTPFQKATRPRDLLGGLLGLRVVPDGVRVLLAVDLEGVVRRGALPRADACGCRRAAALRRDRLGGK